MKVETTNTPEHYATSDYATDSSSTATTSEIPAKMDQAIKSSTSKTGQRPVKISKPRQPPNGFFAKTKRVHSRIIVLVVCLAYIATMFTTLHVGLQEISSSLKPRVENSRMEMQAQGNLRYRQKMLSSQLDDLEDKQLRTSYTETYEDCLARGLKQADANLFGLGFQYPNIRERSMEWATNNCKRLMYAPQVLQPTPQQVVLTQWARTTHEARRILEDVFEKTVDMVNSAWVRCIKVLETRTPNVTVTPVDTKVPVYQSLVIRRRRRPEMPFGFSLDCEASPCRLTYSETSSDKAFVAHDELMHRVLKFDGLSTFYAKTNFHRDIVASLARFFVPLELLFMAVYGAMSLYLMNILRAIEAKNMKLLMADFRPFVTKEECHALELWTIQACMVLIRTMLVGIEDDAKQQDAKFYLVMGLVLMAYGISMLIKLVLNLDYVLKIHTAVTDIHTTLTSMKKDLQTPAAAKASKKPKMDGMHVAPVAQPSAQAFPTRPEPVSLATTDQEDVEATVEVHEQTQYSDYAESGSDSDFDGEPFVDLAGGITPTTEEAGADIVVVDA
ncbi:hypothetical protein CC86DRAFT_96275 [Ophiobolus disseminans]|uniref:Uncharacterized protein n=1 Tax=Ophiobolus disseminans TaxID=1469910 RepID=A0A6A6ZMK9_9PLEO|nr:hypothetical protein CC86DRAFT_96275 [Ophiobolus disseminans]